MDDAIIAVAEVVFDLTDKGREDLRKSGVSWLSGAEIDKCKRIVEAVRNADAERDYYERSMEQLVQDGQL